MNDTLTLSFGSGTWWLYTLCVLAVVGLSWRVYYQTTPVLTPIRRYALITLRSLGLAILILTLFEPLLRTVTSTSTRPVVTVLVDRSASAGMTDATVRRSQQMAEVLETVERLRPNDVRFAVFDGSVSAVDGKYVRDSLDYRGQRTDIASAIRWATNVPVDEAPGALLLVTDGNSNTGQSPIYQAQLAGLPVYSIGIGDTTPPRDVVVRSIAMNDAAIVGMPVPIQVTVGTKGYAGQALPIVVYDGDREVARTTITPIQDRWTGVFDVSFTPSLEGLRSISVKAGPLANEFKTTNNGALQTIHVRSSKRSIVILAGGPSPDVSFVKGALEQQRDYAVSTFVQKQGGEFYGSPPTANQLRDAEAIVTIGFPTANTPRGVVAMVTEAVSKGRSLLWIGGAMVDVPALRFMEPVLPFTVQASRPRELTVTVEASNAGGGDALMRLPAGDATSWAALPPMYRMEMFTRPQGDATVLATAALNGVNLGEPIIMRRTDGGGKVVAVVGHGLYRWKLLGKGQAEARGAIAVTDVLSTFLENGVRYLSVRPNERRVSVRPSRQAYAAGERVDLVASVRDETDRLVDDADVVADVRSSAGSKNVRLSVIGNGRYITSLGTLPPGRYTVAGSASRGGTELGKDNAAFSVGELFLEDLATTVDTVTLSSMAARSGAEFALANNAERVLDALNRDPRLNPVTRTRSSEIGLWSLPWLLAAALCLFSAEWFLRKRSSLP